MRNFFKDLFSNEINNKKQLIEILQDISERNIINKETQNLIEAILNLNKLKAKDIMLPRYQVDFLDQKNSPEAIIEKIARTGHSRFPVIDEEINDLVGIFHSKDLYNFYLNKEEFNLKDHLRPAYFVPEIKNLNSIMFEMRLRRSHMSIVVDEFTNIVGILTLEMIVEQIIGEIEDEHDYLEREREIVLLEPNLYRVKGYCALSELNSTLKIDIRAEYVETIGGYIIKVLSRTPVTGEIINLNNLKIEIVNADSRKIKLMNISKL